ncbi:hypothetical protein [Aliikangiella sp. IMCC44359]|uniref:hypothetical protein n=1 Tax=Aliikangiella sp. IMCC44359 TaxID=3459125 RepID=UPI00403AD532
MKKCRQYIIGFFAVFVSQLNAIEFDAIARTGIDSNPLSLSDEVNPVQEEFAQAGFYSQSSLYDLFYWDINVEKALYFSDSRIDWFDYGADLKLASDFKVLEVPIGYQIGIDYQAHDETYVAKETGLVATYDNNSIADRFDNKYKAYYLGFSYPISSESDIYIHYKNQDNNFTDFDFNGLDNLDNLEKVTTLGVTFYPRDSGHFFLNFQHKVREYNDRRDRNLLGELIVNSNLIFNDYITNVGYIYKPEKGTQWEYSFSYVNRTTNGTQYYDSQRGELKIVGDYKIADYHLLSVGLFYQTFFYDQDLEQSFAYFDQTDIDQSGATLTLEYTWTLATLFETNLSFYANIQASQFDSTNEFYVYQRNQASAGIRWYLD